MVDVSAAHASPCRHALGHLKRGGRATHHDVPKAGKVALASDDIEGGGGSGVGLSHVGIIPHAGLVARLFFCFFLLHKSLSINDLRRGRWTFVVTR